MTGAVLLVATLAALGVTGWAVASCVARGSAITAWLVVGLVAYAEIVVLAVVLSAFGALGRAGFLVGVAACLVGALAAWHVSGRPRAPFGRALGELRRALADPALAVLAALAGLAGGYMTIVALATPQLDWDANAYHLPRAVLWLTQGGIGEIAGAVDVRLSWAPPGDEIVVAFTMAVSGGDRFTALPQLASLLLAVVAVVGIARRTGFGPRAALFGGLTFGCLPVVLLQAPTAFDDVVVAAMLLAAVHLLLGGTRAEAGLAAAAIALALVTKLTAAIALPVLLGTVLLAAPRSWRSVVVAAAAGTAVGSLWFLLAQWRTGEVDGGWGERFGQIPDRSPGEILLRAEGYVLDLFDLSGVVGSDRAWLPIAGAVLAAIAVAALARRAPRSRALALLGAAALVALLPWLVEAARIVLVRVFAYLLRIVGYGDRLGELARDPATAASPFSSWYGAVFALLWVVCLVLAVRELRRRRLTPGVLALVLAPLAFALLFAAATVDDGARGRFFAFPVGLAAASFGLAYTLRVVRLAVPAAAAAVVLVTVVHAEPRPLGIELLEPVRTPAVWGDDRFEGLDAMGGMFGAGPTWVTLDRALRGAPAVAVATRWEFMLYPLFGSDNERRLALGRDPTDAPESVDVLLVTSSGRRPRCDEPWRLTVAREGWYALYERTSGSRCPDDDGGSSDG